MFKHKYLQMFGLKISKNMSDFHPLGVVGRGSETQLQVGENFALVTLGGNENTIICIDRLLSG